MKLRNNYLFGVSTGLLALIALLALVSIGNAEDTASEKVIYTTLDVKVDYDIIDMVTVYQDISTSIAKDPLDGAVKKAWEKLEDVAKKAEADAIIGIRYEISYMTKDLTGKFVIYGTAVRFK